MAEYTFFFNPMSRAQIARWAFHEAAADYEPVFVDWGMLFGTIPERPAFQAYAERLRAREGYRAAKAIDGALIEEMQGKHADS